MLTRHYGPAVTAVLPEATDVCLDTRAKPQLKRARIE